VRRHSHRPRGRPAAASRLTAATPPRHPDPRQPPRRSIQTHASHPADPEVARSLRAGPPCACRGVWSSASARGRPPTSPCRTTGPSWPLSRARRGLVGATPLARSGATERPGRPVGVPGPCGGHGLVERVRDELRRQPSHRVPVVPLADDLGNGMTRISVAPADQSHRQEVAELRADRRSTSGPPAGDSETDWPAGPFEPTPGDTGLRSVGGNVAQPSAWLPLRPSDDRRSAAGGTGRSRAGRCPPAAAGRQHAPSRRAGSGTKAADGPPSRQGRFTASAAQLMHVTGPVPAHRDPRHPSAIP
jgi:hypothetical protein